MKILYIEDHAESRLLVRHILEAEGFDVIEAEDGLSGIRAAEAALPDLILIDIMMPGLDGREVTTRLRSIPRLENIPIVALTAGTVKGDRERSLAAGCDGYLQKPIDVEHLVEQVRQFLQGKRESLSPSEEVWYLREHNKQLAERLAERAQRLQDATEANRRLAENALFDDLTGLPNERYLLLRLGEEYAMAKRLGSPFSCMLAEIDQFQSIKQADGIEMSHATLRLVAKVLSDSKRDYDVFGRYGDPFLFLLRAGVSGTMAMAERLRRKVESVAFSSGTKQPIRLTLSLGVANFESGEDLTMEALLDRASKALQQAKEEGRNRAVLFQASP